MDSLELPSALRQRILTRVKPSNSFLCISETKNPPGGYILYLPTVVLRKRHNPGFALACHLANHFEVPLVVLCTVLDDKHLSSFSDPQRCSEEEQHPPVCMTARRLAFYLEALQSCCREWEDHGAGVCCRVHGPGSRTPHHLTLANQALAVVTDEAFVEPYSLYLSRIVATCRNANVPCWSVDGSTTVPPISMLTPNHSKSGSCAFSGVPSKAWIWEKKTEPQRKFHVYAATRQGHLDAPALKERLSENFFRNSYGGTSSWKTLQKGSISNGLLTVEDLEAIPSISEWAMSWAGSDTTVPPCSQTHGSSRAGRKRWKGFLEGKLKDYANHRNQIIKPQSVSRISCYLNLGILSIFDIVQDVWHCQESKRGYSNGCKKFLEEIVKWREIGYCYTLANSPSDYRHLVQAIPKWSLAYLNSKNQQQQKNSCDGSSSSSSAGYTYQQLETASTKDETWNAMQTYLIETGELHNNARMTWGKTVVHWQVTKYSPEKVLWQLCCLNDRFALDGLSPPSYAGILWCFGWGDKPSSGNSLSTKWSNRYRTGPDGFTSAKEIILCNNNGIIVTSSSSSITSYQPTIHDFAQLATSDKRSTACGQKREHSKDDFSPKPTTKKAKTILSFFSPVAGCRQKTK